MNDADLKMEMSISRMLRAGVSLAAAVVLLGGLLYMLQAHGVAPDYRIRPCNSILSQERLLMLKCGYE